MLKFVDKYRQEAYSNYASRTKIHPTWREAILETIFRPDIKNPPGKTPTSHLHPDLDKMHMPHGVLMADWRKYQVEDHPMLVNFQKRCHAAGLHDPWLRNYAHMCYPNTFPRRSITAIVTQGLLFGMVAAGGLCVVRYFVNTYYPPTNYHSKEYNKKHGIEDKASHH